MQSCKQFFANQCNVGTRLIISYSLYRLLNNQCSRYCHRVNVTQYTITHTFLYH